MGEWFGYIKNELYSDLFPAHVGLKGRALSGKGAAATAAVQAAPAGGKAAAVAVPAAQVQAAAA